MSDEPKRLWAPWRMAYIRAQKKEKGCIFCNRLRKPKSRDRENLIVFRGKRAFVILNRFPYTSGHLMVAPNEHIANLEELDEETFFELFVLIKRSILAIKKAFSPHGFNIGANLGECAGAGVKDHLHFHVVPRWVGDTNFMPVVGNVRVVSQDLKKTYDELVKIF